MSSVAYDPFCDTACRMPPRNVNTDALTEALCICEVRHFKHWCLCEVRHFVALR